MLTLKGKSIFSWLLFALTRGLPFLSLSSDVQSGLDSFASILRDWVDRQLEDPSVLTVSEMIALLDNWRGYLVYHRTSSSASTAIRPVTKLIPAVMKLVNSSSLAAHTLCASFVSLLAEDIKRPGADPLGSVGTLIAVSLAAGKVLLAKAATGEGESTSVTRDMPPTH